MALTLLVTVDVLGRLPGRLNAHGLGFTLPWTTEVTEYALYWMTFLGAPWVLKEGGHISIDILPQRLGPAARARLARVIALLGALISAILLYYAIAVLLKAVHEQTQIVRTLTVKEWWIYAPLPVCVLLMLAIFTGWLFHPPEQRFPPQEGL